MFLRAKDGIYAGEIREYPPHIGKQLLADGRAEDPYAEPPTAAAQAAKAAETRRNRRRSAQ